MDKFLSQLSDGIDEEEEEAGDISDKEVKSGSKTFKPKKIQDKLKKN